MSVATGWAVRNNSGIDIRTVSDTRRAAIVNWLVVEAGIAVLNSATDAQIEGAWRRSRGMSEVVQVKVLENIG